MDDYKPLSDWDAIILGEKVEQLAEKIDTLKNVYNALLSLPCKPENINLPTELFDTANEAITSLREYLSERGANAVIKGSDKE